MSGRHSVPAAHGAWARALASRRHRGGPCGSCAPGLGGVATRGLRAGAVVPRHRGPPRWLRQHAPEQADALSWRARGQLPAPRAHQAPAATRGHPLPGPQGLALPVPSLAVPGTAAPERAGVCAGPALRPLGRSRHPHGRDGHWRAGTALVAGPAGGRVGSPCRPAEASDQHPGRPGSQRQGAEPVRQAGVASSRGPAPGVAHRAGTPRHPGPVSVSGHACRAVWGGSGRRACTDTRRVPACPQPHVWRVSLSR